MRDVVGAIEAELERYKRLAEAAIGQLSDHELAASYGGGNASSISTIVWHIAGNLRSRFTDFLTSDGEKPWRDRDSEFAPRQVGRDELLAFWQSGWTALTTTLAALTDSDLPRTVMIRGQSLSVGEALQRAAAHVAYHVGQIVFVAKGLRGTSWTYLSIPPGQSAAYNQNPTRERPTQT